MLEKHIDTVFRSSALTVTSNPVSDIPRWHFAMLNDQERNQAFYDAIEATDFTEKTVLDIGTGSGLLAMWAARKGASHVYTCECNPLVAAKARDIIKLNGLESNITVITKLSTDLVPGTDLPGNIDVLISETVDCGFFGEGFGHSLLHARRELLAPEAKIIPQGVELYACLLSSQEVANLNGVSDDIFGIDVSGFNKFRTVGYFPVRLNTWQHHLLSDSVNFYCADFQSELTFSKSCDLAFTAKMDSRAHGVVFWFKLRLIDDICLSNDPRNYRSHWMQAVQLFDHPIGVQKGHTYRVSLAMSPAGIEFGKCCTPINLSIVS